MCGIAGIVGQGFGGRPDAAAMVRDMVEAMRNRGPDAAGVELFPDVCLGHVRLKIFDLSDHANQPMRHPAGYTMVFNGEIYNFPELTAELKDEYRFKTSSDTEVALAAYAKWGLKAFSKFNGDWAIAIWDENRKELVLSRDRFGIKPLYYGSHAGRTVFASEIRAFPKAGFPVKVSRAALARLIKEKKNEYYNATFCVDIEPVPPGHVICVDTRGRRRNYQYYDDDRLFQAAVPGSFEEAAEAYGELFKSAVELRLRSDVPVGVCLSGGLDSSAIAAVAGGIFKKDVRTYSAVFPGDQSDESYFSREVVRYTGLRNMEVLPDSGALIDSFEQLVYAQDMAHASADTLGRFFVLAAASKEVTVVLDGQGGDEVFGGYRACMDIYNKNFPPAGYETNEIVVYDRGLERGDIDIHEVLGIPAEAGAGRVRWKSPLKPGLDEYTGKQLRLLRNNLLSLLHTEDRLTMHFSIEGRVPFLDHRLVEFCFSSPVPFRIGRLDKKMAREWLGSSGLLPPSITQRRDKKGFSTPYRRILLQRESRDELCSRFMDLLSSDPAVFDRDCAVRLLKRFREGGFNDIDLVLACYSTLITIGHWRAEITD